LEFKKPTDCFSLANGVKIPCIGFGTWQTPDGEIAVSAVEAALGAGYRHIDGAPAYDNEASTGIALKNSGIDRGDVFITGKLFNRDRGYDETIAAFEKTLSRLRTDYLDLYLIHWPNPIAFRDRWAEMNAESWRAFEDLYAAGRIRAIGVSNFHAHHLDALEKTAKVRPMVNQIRLCPGDTQYDVVKTSRERSMLLEAYSPFGGSGPANVLRSREVTDTAAKYGKTPAQLCVRWCLQHGFLPLPKSASQNHIAGNTDVFGFEIDARDMELLDNLKGYDSPFPHPDNTTW
jgi:diketogulonate reductase-like aldo/keto reductase